MGIFDGFAEGFASAMDDIRHKVVEEPTYGREVTGNIELPQQEPPVEPTSWQQATQDIEPPQQEPPEPSRDLER